MNRKIYIDFDGVILDTWEVISKKYYEKFNTTEIHEEKIKKIMLIIGWNYILDSSREINCSLKKIKEIGTKYDVWVLTKINSIEEKDAKIKFLKKNNIEKICFVPYTSSKTQYVDPKNNILIDDDLKNLEEWEQQGGISIFFNENILNYDSYGNKNTKYAIMNDLLQIYSIV